MSHRHFNFQPLLLQDPYSGVKVRVAVKITAIYLIVGFLWIIFSDQLLSAIFIQGDAITRLQTLKGWFYVLMTAGLLYWLIERENIITRRAIRQLKQALHDLQQTQEMLRASEQQFRQAIVNAPYPAILHGEDGEILQINQVWTELTGYNAEDIPTIADWTEKAYGQRMEIVRSEIDQLYSLNARVHEGEFTLYTKTGQERIWDFSSAPVGYLSDGRRLVLSMAVDVTEQKKVQQEKELNRLKSRFISTVSHEFRTPLTVIRTAAELLEKRQNLSPDKRNDYLQRIKTSVASMSHLIDDVLILGQADADRLVCRPADLDLQQFCQNLVDEFLMVEDRSHTIQLIIQGECRHTQMDEKLLRYILTNILSNAIKYSSAGSTIQFDLRADSTENIATFQIQDQGIGIPESEQERLFESFFRASNVNSIQGTGLGLAIVKRCVDAHQGQIEVFSQISVGTTVSIVLPLRSDRLVEG